MEKNLKKRFITLTRYLLAALILLLLLILFFRNSITDAYIQRKIDRFNVLTGARLKIEKVRIKGLASVEVTGITLAPPEGDTLCKIDTAYASIGILKLLSGHLAIHDVHLINSTFNLIRKDSTTNYRFLLKKNKETGDTISSTVNYAAAADRLTGLVFDKIPRSLSISNLRLVHRDGDHQTTYSLKSMEIRKHFFHAPMQVEEEGETATWIVAGRIDNARRMVSFRIYSNDTASIRIPFAGYRWNAGIRFDTLSFSINEERTTEAATRFSGYFAVKGLSLTHEKIAAVPVTFDHLAIDYRVTIGADYLELDSASVVTFNRLVFHPYARYRPHPSKQILFSFHKGLFPAEDLFTSLPAGLFANLDGIRVQGSLSWYLNFGVDLAQPDSLLFETSLDRHRFSLIGYGASDLGRMNGSFTYTAYEHDLPVRTFVVGPENPNFRPLHRIAHYLQVAVMTAEDGGFYQHRGFLPDAFRESMITDIKERRFARGGSTISMQLVKNVFLNRNKTIARKLEEALIVWLIENQGITSKDRMFEVYLNIIEWGPLVYGANEAARFYFNKDASRLTLSEALFMASIIPRPKGFRYAFDETGHLKASNAEFFTLCKAKMVAKGWITPGEAEKALPDIELKGAAKELLKTHDSVITGGASDPE
ncbi:MAG TPA: biosynthetic peptidoglycan transglycosylase [Bacteroidales bacterium]|nr:biosynthetic peptidoglycan transglycosylase [Bacteroidales bacterium]HPT09230.1 biosynthetic peptidoglycan transglycosylase [Bacteroidales bacterium]